MQWTTCTARPSQIPSRVPLGMSGPVLCARTPHQTSCFRRACTLRRVTLLTPPAPSVQGFALRPVHTLSGGQKQRVAIAGALAERPQACATARRCVLFAC